MNELIEAWFAKHFHGLGPALDVTMYNRLVAAKEDLKDTLATAPPKKEK